MKNQNKKLNHISGGDSCLRGSNVVNIYLEQLYLTVGYLQLITAYRFPQNIQVWKLNY